MTNEEKYKTPSERYANLENRLQLGTTYGIIFSKDKYRGM